MRETRKFNETWSNLKVNRSKREISGEYISVMIHPYALLYSYCFIIVAREVRFSIMVKPNFHAIGTKNDFHRSNQPSIGQSIYLDEVYNRSTRHSVGLVSLLTLARKYSNDYETGRSASVSYLVIFKEADPLKIVVADRRGARYPVETFYQGRGRASPFIFWPFDESDMPDIPRWNTRATRDGIEYLTSKFEPLLER